VALSAEITAAHTRSRGTYGSHRELRARGIRIGRKRVERLMREKDLKGAQERPFHCTTDWRHSLPIAPYTPDREFDPAAADRVWAANVTYIATDEGWLNLAVMLDLFSRHVEDWGISCTNDTALASEALRWRLDPRLACCITQTAEAPARLLRTRRFFVSMPLSLALAARVTASTRRSWKASSAL
jgi:putative transposase